MDESHDLLAAYALNALSDSERGTFEHHLEDCERCRVELAGFADTAAALAIAVEPATPAPELRARVLAGARREGEVIRLRRYALPAAASVAALAASAALGIGIWAASLHSSLSDERSARAAAGAALAVLADPAARRVLLSGGRSGVLAVRADGTAALAIRELERAPEGKAYEAWVIHGKTPRPAGLFGGGSQGATLVVLQRRVARGATVAVTVEPAAGVVQPTTTPILSARV
jgi:anti-sigma-K factor RskA